MNLLETKNRINHLISVLVTEVKGAAELGQTDINVISEDVIKPLFAEVYDLRNIGNLNETERRNFPGIDLADDIKKVAIQVTATPDIGKIKHALKMFIKYELYKKYTRLIVFVLTERQNTYRQSSFESIIEGRFTFDPENDVIDHRNVLRALAHFPIERLDKVRDILESNIGSEHQIIKLSPDVHQSEKVHLNLLPLTFPSYLYIAELGDDDQHPKSDKRIGQRKLTRGYVRSALAEHGLKFAVDWVCFKNQIVSFHDLGDPHLPLNHVTSLGSVSKIRTEEFYGKNEDYENRFKELLGRCLQQKLFHRGVKWQNTEKLYIFDGVDGELSRTEQWQGKRDSEREVYNRVMKKNNSNEIYHCKHLAFGTRYIAISGTWYLIIKPDWYFSRDGYNPWSYASERVDWLKKRENNSQVLNHLRFIVYFLKQEKPLELFKESHPYRFLSFGKLLEFDSTPSLDDDSWNPPHPKVNQDFGRKRTKQARLQF